MTSPLARPAWRGRTNVDALTIAAIEAAEKRAGFKFVVTQGSYQSTVAASADTHAGGGAVDLRTKDLAAARKHAMVLALREVGFAAWLRKPAQGPWVEHVHAILVDHPLLSAGARRQVVDYRAGRNGLANRSPDDGPRVHPIPVFTWPTEPATLPKRVQRYLKETKATRQAVKREIQRLKAARDVAKRRGENLQPYRDALAHARRARKQLRKTRQKIKRADRR